MSLHRKQRRRVSTVAAPSDSSEVIQTRNRERKAAARRGQPHRDRLAVRTREPLLQPEKGPGQKGGTSLLSALPGVRTPDSPRLPLLTSQDIRKANVFRPHHASFPAVSTAACVPPSNAFRTVFCLHPLTLKCAHFARASGGDPRTPPITSWPFYPQNASQLFSRATHVPKNTTYLRWHVDRRSLRKPSSRGDSLFFHMPLSQAFRRPPRRATGRVLTTSLTFLCLVSP